MAPYALHKLCVVFLATVLCYHPLSQGSVHAIALPELANPAPLQPATQINAVEKRTTYDPDCTDTLASVPTIAGAEGAVTITVTVFVPSTTSRASASTSNSASVPATSSTRSVSAPSASPAGTQPSSSSSASTSVQTPSAAAGLRAQQLNFSFANIQVTDSCTAGQRACIDNMLAECVASSSGGTEKWATQACPVTSSNEGMTCAAIPFVSSTSPSTTSSAPTSTPTGLAGDQPIPLTDSLAIGCFTKANISQRFSSSGVGDGMFPPGIGNGALERFRFRLDGTIVLALIVGLMLW